MRGFPDHEKYFGLNVGGFFASEMKCEVVLCRVQLLTDGDEEYIHPKFS